MTTAASRKDELVALAHKIGKEAVAPHAADVDQKARFPHEAFARLRQEKLLSAYVPEKFGGMGIAFSELSAICHALGQHCASTAMVFAMHQIQVACIVRHGTTPYFEAYQRELVERQLLLASATTEEGIGGDVRSSSCAVVASGGRFTLEKRAPVISYGEETDDTLVTARRAPDAATSDQVIVLVRKADTKLERTHSWDTLGMRGTCSLGFHLAATGSTDQIIPMPYADVSAQTMHPVSHLLWSSLWLGIATDALNQARAFVRAEARKKPGTTPAGALRLAEAQDVLHQMRSTVFGNVADYESRMDDRDALSSPSFTIRMNDVKLTASEKVVDVTTRALRVCGIAGYKADSKYSLARHLRDAHGAALMINNDRILGANAQLLLVAKED